jgi:phosphoribosyl-ATP pyrophosphohydrolase
MGSDQEGKEAAASEMADVLYHAMVLLNKQGAVSVSRPSLEGVHDAECTSCVRRMLHEGRTMHAGMFLTRCAVVPPHAEVPLADVCAVLRERFGTSGIEEKAARAPKQ